MRSWGSVPHKPLTTLDSFCFGCVCTPFFVSVLTSHWQSDGECSGSWLDTASQVGFPTTAAPLVWPGLPPGTG